jgi:hypothetical protein
MPYFVYEVVTHPESGARLLTYLETCPKYRDAKLRVKKERDEHPERDQQEFRLVYAKNQTEAEKLLSIPRDERVIGDI